MANLPGFGRAWQRLSAIPRPLPTPQPAAVPEPAVSEPQIAPSAPTTQNLQPFEPNPPPTASSPPSSPTRESTSRLSSPSRKAASPSSSPKHKATHTTTRVASPPMKSARSPPSPTYKRYDGRREVSPTSHPKTVKHAQSTPPQSPKYRRTAAPVSPLTLPQTQVKSADGTTTHSRSPPKVEQKSVLYQKTAEKPAKSDRQLEHGTGKPTQKQQPDVINITGHNVGAVMEIRQSSDKREGGEIIKKKETEGSGYDKDERKTGGRDKSQKANKLPTTSFMNSNFQGVNNSLLHDSSCNHRDPGLHLAFSEQLNDNGTTVDGNRDFKR